MKELLFKGGSFALGEKKLIMGILNVTPDSFSDGGKYLRPDSALTHAAEMVKNGVDIIDVGAMSTRPYSEPVSPEEELCRLMPVFDGIKKLGAVISVDTVYPETAEYALENGASIINDVSGKFNEDMAYLIKKHRAGWVVTHTAGPASESIAQYPNGVVAAVNDYFNLQISLCENFGINKKQLCLDAGFGFAKTDDENITLLNSLERVIRDDIAFLVAVSKKRFTLKLGDSRETGTASAHEIALKKGCDIIRVHDVNSAVNRISHFNSHK